MISYSTQPQFSRNGHQLKSLRSTYISDLFCKRSSGNREKKCGSGKIYSDRISKNPVFISLSCTPRGLRIISKFAAWLFFLPFEIRRKWKMNRMIIPAWTRGRAILNFHLGLQRRLTNRTKDILKIENSLKNIFLCLWWDGFKNFLCKRWLFFFFCLFFPACLYLPFFPAG